MTTHPSADELLQAVMAWLDRAPGETVRDAGRDAYLRLVARNALGIVQREFQLRPGADARAAARLRDLLGFDAALPELEAALAGRLRNGDIALDDAALLAHLRLRSLDLLAIDQPRYRHGLSA